MTHTSDITIRLAPALASPGKVGVDPSAISRIESGYRLPGPDDVDALESALKLKKRTLASAVIAKKRKKRDWIRQLKRLVYNSRLSIEEIRRRLG